VNAQWQPIETAPKDGTWLRVMCANGKEDRQRWCDYTGDKYRTLDGEWDAELGEGDPTYWMPVNAQGETWTAEVLSVDPFEGDYGGSGSGDRILSDAVVTCRKAATCHACNGQCEPKTAIRRRVEVYDGELMSFAWCNACCKAMADYSKNPEGLEARYEIGELARAHALGEER
jgi:hypothetical protein